MATALGYLSAALLLGAGVEGQLLRDKFGATLDSVPTLSPCPSRVPIGSVPPWTVSPLCPHVPLVSPQVRCHPGRCPRAGRCRLALVAAAAGGGALGGGGGAPGAAGRVPPPARAGADTGAATAALSPCPLGVPSGSVAAVAVVGDPADRSPGGAVPVSPCPLGVPVSPGCRVPWVSSCPLGVPVSPGCPHVPSVSPQALSRGRLWPLSVTLLTAALGVLLGSLDLLAPVLSVLCLTSHLGLNLACALQGLLPTAGWSPRCPLYHWSVSLAGALLCLSLMFVTCWHCALLALGIGATAYKYLEFRSAQTEWGEGLRGLSLSAARLALLRLEDGRPPPPSLRPQLLVLSKPGDPPGPPPRPELVALAAQLQGGGRGLTVLGAVLGGALHEELPRARGAERALRVALARAGARGFVQVLVTPEPGAGLAALVQGVGLGALRPNTVLLGWPRRWRQQPDPARAARDFVELLRVAGAAGRALLVSKGGAEPDPAPGLSPGLSPCPGLSPGVSPVPEVSPGVSPRGSLDVWWVVGTGRLLTLLPLLLRQHPVWRGCPLRLFMVALLEDNSERLRRLLEAVVRRRGLPAQVHVVELHDGAVSDYTYERTLMMEQRSQMLRQLRRAQGGPAPSQPPSAAEEEEGGGGEPRRGPSP
ncbi:solute carrier family 12 member 4-like [Serinus canaria]|uniref:solute carrier family 12 member 4-like n=1 Tax=Serinus canaria TaxID=9135 RepID=UPI0021CC954A|nr:solute carrier family 12 member 4-like [Serinus canaria]